MDKDKNPGGRPTIKDKPALLLYRILKPVAKGEDEPTWIHLKCDTQFHNNKAAAKTLLIKTLEKANIEHPVEYKILVLNEHQNLVPQTTTKFVEEKISDEEPEPEPTEDELPLEKETEPIETENDMSENEEPGADIG